MKKIEVKLIHNRENRYFRLTVNGEDVYNQFSYTENTVDEVETLAKSYAFDEVCKGQREGSVTASYHVF